MPPYSEIGIIYNPNSTGDAPKMAKRLYKKLLRKLPDLPITMYETEHAGHAIDLAYELALRAKNPLIVSVSGDGGYNEVINGALKAQMGGAAQPVCAVYGAGNANDHRRTLKENPLSKAIIEGKICEIDLLKIEVKSKKKQPTVYFAHSYIGLGFTPAVATELNRHQLNRWRETLLLIKTFFRFKPFSIELDGRKRQYDSLVFANINQMAKVLTISKSGRPDDGRFEVIEQPHKRKVTILFTAAKAALFGLGQQPRRTKYEFAVIEDLPMQLDGELKELKKGDKVVIRSAPRSLRTIL